MINVHRSSCMHPLLLSDFSKTWIFSTDFRKIHIKFHENPSSGNRVVSCGQMDRKTDMTQLFRNFVNTRKSFHATINTHCFNPSLINQTSTNTHELQRLTELQFHIRSSVHKYCNTVHETRIHEKFLCAFRVCHWRHIHLAARWKYWVGKDIWRKFSFSIPCAIPRLQQWVSVPEANAEYWQTLEMSKKNYKRVFSHRLKVHISPKYVSYYVNINFIRRFCLFRIWYVRVQNSTWPHFTVRTEYHSTYE